MPTTYASADKRDFASRIASDTVRIERTLPGPIERVWAYLTEPDKCRLWLAGGHITPQLGGAIELQFRHAELSDQPGVVPARHADMAVVHVQSGRITAWQPPHMLSYTWGDTQGTPSEVRFELAAHGDDVLLTVMHTRLDPAEMRSVAGGWHTHLDILVDRLNGRTSGSFWTAYTRLETEYARRL
ncbi:MAG: SRPBCC family protein [Luteimonas sp.]